MQEIVKKIREQLKGSGWADALYGILSDTEFERIIEQLAELKEQDIRFTPKIQVAFRFLQECPWDKVKAVILTDHTSNLMDYADGIPYSNSKQKYADRILEELWNPLKIADKNFTGNKDLTRWTKQGLLIMPLALTATINKKSHKDIWKPFILYIIDILNHHKNNMPWVLINKSSQRYEDSINSIHQMKAAMVPYKKFTDDIYGYINRILRQQDKQEIRW